MSGDDTSTFQQIVPKKLKIPKFNRPDPNLLDEKIQTYRELVSAKLRNLEPETKRIYRWKNNLKFSTRIALNELRNLVANNRVVICRSDKDGKVIVADFTDYNRIMRGELQQFFFFSYFKPLYCNNLLHWCTLPVIMLISISKQFAPKPIS